MLYWFSARAILPSSQSVAPATNSRTTAQASLVRVCGPYTTSQKKNGTPASRARLSALGTVSTRDGSSGGAAGSVSGGIPPGCTVSSLLPLGRAG